MPAGRPRSEAAHNAILAAAREELTAEGYDKLTIERVAVRARVAKQTVYRWYPSKSALVAECLIHGFINTPPIEVGGHGDVRADIRAWAGEFVMVTQDPQAVGLIRAAGAAAAENKDIARAFQDNVKTLARDSLASRMQRGEDAGELRPGLHASAVAEVIVGSLIYRLVTHEEITMTFVDDLMTTIFDGIAMPKDATTA